MKITEDTIKKYAREYLDLKEEIERLQARKESLADKFKEELGTTSKATFGKYTITTFEQVRPNVSAKAIKEEMPEVYEKYGHDSIITSVRVKEA